MYLRRRFLKNAGATTSLGALALLNRLYSAQGTTTQADYKTLVCVFLYGGSDSLSMTVPIGRNRGFYAKMRGGEGKGITVAQPSSPESWASGTNPPGYPLPLKPRNSVNYTNGMETGWFLAQEGFRNLYKQGYLAVVGGVGPLVDKVRLNFSEDGKPTGVGADTGMGLINSQQPTNLASHSDQQLAWQSFIPLVTKDLAQNGWGARLAHYINRTYSQTNRSYLAMTSMAGWNLFETGNGLVGTEIGLNGPLANPWAGKDNGKAQEMNRLAKEILKPKHYENLLEREFAIRSRKALLEADGVKGDYDSVAGDIELNNHINTAFPGEKSNLDLQFINAIRMIKSARSGDNPLRRQMIFISQDGYDTHSGTNVLLLDDLAKSIEKFYKCLHLISHSLVDEVTSFTMSDFGRNSLWNTTGTDHGWGANHLVFGGAIKGGFYGKMQDRFFTDYTVEYNRDLLFETKLVEGDEVSDWSNKSNTDKKKIRDRYTYGDYTVALSSFEGNDIEADTPLGTFIPQISCEEYVLPLAHWFGLSTSDDIQREIFPNMYYKVDNTYIIRPAWLSSSNNLGYIAS
jgi:uncharacterized protein (DUF1501 family)